MTKIICMDISNYKLDIFILAGQSNANGNGQGDEELIDSFPDGFEMFDTINSVDVLYKIDPRTREELFNFIMPSKYDYRTLQSRKILNGEVEDMSISFAKEYANKYLASDRRILFIKCGVGGCGFSKKHWGLGQPLYQRLLDMTKEALSLNKENRLVGFLWHQGEHDAFEQEWLSPKERYQFYYNNLNKILADYINKFDDQKFPVIAGEFCNEWADKNKVACDAVESALKDVIHNLNIGDVVSSEGLQSNNQAIGNGDDIHFSRKAIIELGKRYFASFDKLMNK